MSEENRVKMTKTNHKCQERIFPESLGAGGCLFESCYAEHRVERCIPQANRQMDSILPICRSPLTLRRLRLESAFHYAKNKLGSAPQTQSTRDGSKRIENMVE